MLLVSYMMGWAASVCHQKSSFPTSMGDNSFVSFTCYAQPQIDERGICAPNVTTAETMDAFFDLHYKVDLGFNKVSGTCILRTFDFVSREYITPRESCCLCVCLLCITFVYFYFVEMNSLPLLSHRASETYH